ncbi:MAG: hypothetical protein GF313_11975 [Caldithrix sp.]|nr:hypothetical protein [Caldithrix sp.]
MNPDLLKLYSEFDYLYRDIGLICRDCRDHDCEGYVWLLKDETESLLDIDVQIVEINDNTSFIHSFEEEGDVVRVDKLKPPCRLREAGLCTIYKNRPLVCRMYPVGLVTDKDDVVVALHQDCGYARRLNKSDKQLFFQRVLGILRRTPKALLREWLESYLLVDRLSAFPEGLNTFEVISSLKVILNERR